MKDIGVLLELHNFRDTLVMKVMTYLPLYVGIHGFHTVHKRGYREYIGQLELLSIHSSW